MRSTRSHSTNPSKAEDQHPIGPPVARDHEQGAFAQQPCDRHVEKDVTATSQQFEFQLGVTHRIDAVLAAAHKLIHPSVLAEILAVQ